MLNTNLFTIRKNSSYIIFIVTVLLTSTVLIYNFKLYAFFGILLTLVVSVIINSYSNVFTSYTVLRKKSNKRVTLKTIVLIVVFIISYLCSFIFLPSF